MVSKVSNHFLWHALFEEHLFDVLPRAIRFSIDLFIFSSGHICEQSLLKAEVLLWKFLSHLDLLHEQVVVLRVEGAVSEADEWFIEDRSVFKEVFQVVLHLFEIHLAVLVDYIIGVRIEFLLQVVLLNFGWTNVDQHQRILLSFLANGGGLGFFHQSTACGFDVGGGRRSAAHFRGLFQNCFRGCSRLVKNVSSTASCNDLCRYLEMLCGLNTQNGQRGFLLRLTLNLETGGDIIG